MDNDFSFGYSHRHKRTHAQMDHEGSSSPTWGSFNRLSASREPTSPHPQVSGLHLPRIGNMPPAQPRRYPGDGMDYRRPASLSTTDSQAAVIDLTADDAGPSASNSRRITARAQRPPRFDREIIDLVEEDVLRSTASPESPEIEFISSRRIDPPRRPDPPAFSYANADEDDVEFVSVNRLPVEQRGRHHIEDMMVGVFEDMVRDDVNSQGTQYAHFRQIHRVANSINQPPVVPPRSRGAGRPRIHVGFVAPTMDFEMVGFDLGLGLGAGPAPPPPTYDKPDAAPEGFTRSSAEEDVLICPNCEEELCGGDSDLKKQVWIVKGCGHVYCGECTANRFVKRSAKGKEKTAPPRTQPFKVCVVDGCEKKTSSPKSMIQVFL